MTIVGSTYIETCLYPHWKELYGSGWRAACALIDHLNDIRFYTYLSQKDEEILSLNPVYNEVESVNLTFINQTITFEYFHGLSEPKIFPHPCSIQQNVPIEAVDDVVLRYGFIEGDAKVKGKKVVYDPQSATAPKDFYENGSEADELVMVLNFREAALLSGFNEVSKIADTLLKGNTIALILKLGPSGGQIITKGTVTNYNVYKTNSVFPIGTGDIFAAFIAFFWGKEGRELEEAATLASKAVAVYCESQTLPIKSGFQNKIFTPVREVSSAQNKKVYLAGPFFTMHQRWLIEESRNNLRGLGFDVFSPIHDVGKGIAEDVVPADIKGIEDSDILFAIVDGLDTGTIFEIGYAKALNMGVIVYVENETEEDLKMLEGTGCIIEHDFVSAIYKAKWLAMESE
ncbi:PfkB family carbohydrate kinase [Sulfurovum sp.]|uniref:PfkB family carbohydrate kinase n=1 Tax=Sulfurovum sp. TaxID=1969726 RepID=UPI0035691CA3